ncbi:hypothetical protein ACFVYG_20290 [Streptomyces sp. NPDC058256]|uniref:hypothetical protein n=1 Tax=Streptomyces sp. NPDC058256 TaxID=3346408 RepID=UPI0036E712AE
MQADAARRRMARGLIAAMFAAAIVVVGPSSPRAEADPGWLNPCNAPGGSYVCDKAEEGAEWLYDKSGTGSLVEGVSEAIDFGTDPLGYMEQKLRSGTQGMFEAFGEELTGKKPSTPSAGN